MNIYVFKKSFEEILLQLQLQFLVEFMINFNGEYAELSLNAMSQSDIELLNNARKTDK